MNFVPSTITVPNRCNVSTAVQIPDNCASVLGPAHNNRPCSAGSNTIHRFLVSTHDMGDRNTERYSVAAYQLPESNSVIIAPRYHVFAVRECDAVTRNGFDGLNHLGCLCQQGLETKSPKRQTFRSTTILTSSDLSPRGYHSTCSSAYGGTETTPAEYAPMLPIESTKMECTGHPAPRSERGLNRTTRRFPARTFQTPPTLLQETIILDDSSLQRER